MRIGIDISQLAYPNTGVANYLENLIEHLLQIDQENEYILFFSSLRKRFQNSKFKDQKHSPRGEAGSPRESFGEAGSSKVKIKEFRFPPTLLDLLWNKLHIVPIEWLIGDIDIFITSDWTEPPTKRAKKATIIYDMIVYKYPEETHNQTSFSFNNFLLSPNIVATQKRRLSWVKKESGAILCISEATKRDVQDILGISEEKLHVIYPGLSV